MRVHELAKQLKLETKELLETLKSLGIKVKGHMSTLDEKQVKILRSKCRSTTSKPKTSTTKKKTVTKKTKPRPVAKKAAPRKKPLTKVVRKKVKSALRPVITKTAEKPRPAKEPKIKLETEKLVVKEKEAKKLDSLEMDFPVNIKELSVKLGEKPSVLIKKLMAQKLFVNLNQSLDNEIAKSLAGDFGYELKPAATEEEKLLAEHLVESKENLKHRHAVVTFMGHVDHGKTSILDYIRKSKLADQEHGGITQHIGAYEVNLKKGKITFLDTPGHEAFTAMRARGANVTDVIVLVVAADDGIMPQTIEAIDHAKAADVPIVVAINKVDKAPENVAMVKGQLSKYGLTSEDLGGETITMAVSAKTGKGIDELLELILLEAEMLELKADFDRLASGVVIEANLSKGRGVEVTVLVQQGILGQSDIVLMGDYFGKIKAMFDSLGEVIKSAGPSTAVKLLGLSGIPLAGDKFYVVKDEKLAKEIASKRKELKKKEKSRLPVHISLEDLHKKVQEGKVKEFKIILKADVQGSLGALKDSLTQLATDEVKITIIHSGVGAINSSDVILAAASDAIIIGFHVSADILAKETAQKEGVEIRTYRVIYEAIREVKAALEGLLEPTIKRIFLGRAVIKNVFKLTKSGKVAGCLVQKGTIRRNNMIAVLRNGEKLFEGKLANLKRFKDDAREVTEGIECGITLSGFQDIQEGDIIEAFEEERIARKL